MGNAKDNFWVLIPSIRSKSQNFTIDTKNVYGEATIVLIPSIRSKSQNSRILGQDCIAYSSGLNPFYQV